MGGSVSRGKSVSVSKRINDSLSLSGGAYQLLVGKSYWERRSYLRQIRCWERIITHRITGHITDTGDFPIDTIICFHR
jgi:hypothetical protein